MSERSLRPDQEYLFGQLVANAKREAARLSLPLEITPGSKDAKEWRYQQALGYLMTTVQMQIGALISLESREMDKKIRGIYNSVIV